MTIAAIRAGLVANLQTSFPDVQCTGYEMAAPKPPCFEIAVSRDDGLEFNQAANRGVEEYNMIVRGIVSNMIDQRSQELLDEWLAPSGATSVRAAIESDVTLGGEVEALVVDSVTNYRAFAVASLPNVTFLAAEWTVRVYASGA